MLQMLTCRMDVAARYGTDAAIFLHNIVFWTLKNKAEKRHFHDGRYWMYASMNGLAELYPLWSAPQIKRIIAKLRESGALLVGDYNEDRQVRTNWYAPSDEILALYDDGVDLETKRRNRKMPPEKEGKAFSEIVQRVDEIGKCNIEQEDTQVDITSPTVSQLCVQEVKTVLADVKVHDDNRSAIAEVALALEQNGFLCQCGVMVPARSSDEAYRGRINILATKQGKSIALSLDRQSVREKSIYMLREFPCDCRIILLRSQYTPKAPAGIDAVLPLTVIAAEDPFLKFWDAYPRKVDKQRALQAWKRLNPGPELYGVIMQALERQKRSAQWTRDDGRYIPHAATWLNGRRWEDVEVPPAGTQPAPERRYGWQ